MKKEEVKTGKKSPWQVFFFIIDFHEKSARKKPKMVKKLRGENNLSVRYVTENVSLLSGPQKRKA